MVLTDGDGGTSAAVTTTVTVSAGNQPPVVTTNFGLTVTEGGSGVISQFVLQATDPDNTPDELTFTVTAGPAHGTLLVNGTAATTFTQADINAGVVSYLNDGSESFTDSFTFTVSDGHSATGSATFTIFVSPANDPPTVMTNAGLTVVRGVVGRDRPRRPGHGRPGQHLVAAHVHGHGRPGPRDASAGGLPVAAFTQADIDAGRVRYVNDGAAATTDTFTSRSATGPTGPARRRSTSPWTRSPRSRSTRPTRRPSPAAR